MVAQILQLFFFSVRAWSCTHNLGKCSGILLDDDIESDIEMGQADISRSPAAACIELEEDEQPCR